MADDQRNEYDKILDREDAHDRWLVMVRADFEQLVDAVKRGVTPLWPVWLRRLYGDKGDE